MLKDIVINDFARETYAHLHSIAELGFEEFKTSEFLANELERYGYKVTRNIGTTGILGVLDSGVEGLCFGLRADMDALPFIVDGKDVAIHACGHDANSAMVLTIAKEVAEKGINKGKFVIIFQQAEEKVGAVGMINDHDFTFIDELLGIHLRPIAEGKLGEATHALYHSASKFVKMTVKGKTAHGARPHLGVNAIEIATAIISAANTLRENITIPHTIKVTQIQSIGNPTNSIPDTVNLAFDLRAQTNEVMDNMCEKIKNIAENTAALYGGSIENLDINGVVAAEYDEDLKEVCKNAIEEVLGNTLGEMYTTGGEDFHYFKTMCGIKTGYLGIGADLTPGVHDANMTFDLKALDIGVEILRKIVEKKFY